jgi:hypothetical protein
MSTNLQSVPNDKVVIVACPVSTSEVRHVAGVGVHVQYDTGKRSSLQFLLSPKEARLEFGAALKKSLQTRRICFPLQAPWRPSHS